MKNMTLIKLKQPRFHPLKLQQYLSLLSLSLEGGGGGLIDSTLDAGSSGPGLSPGRGHCVAFLGKILNSQSASLHLGV